MTRQHLLVMLTAKPSFGRGGTLLPVKVQGLTAAERQTFVTKWGADPATAHAWLIVNFVTDAKGVRILTDDDMASATAFDPATVKRMVERILATPAPAAPPGPFGTPNP